MVISKAVGSKAALRQKVAATPDIFSQRAIVGKSFEVRGMYHLLRGPGYSSVICPLFLRFQKTAVFAAGRIVRASSASTLPPANSFGSPRVGFDINLSVYSSLAWYVFCFSRELYLILLYHLPPIYELLGQNTILFSPCSVCTVVAKGVA